MLIRLTPTAAPGAKYPVMDQSHLQHAAQLDALRKFARRKKLSEEVVVALFESERQHLTKGAKVGRFVDILAEKRAKAVFGRRNR